METQEVKTAKELPENLELVTDDLEVTELNEYFSTQNYDGFLVDMVDGELTEVWGFYGLPTDEAPVYRII